MLVRPALLDDADAIWSIFQAVVATGDSLVFAAGTPRAEALAYWMDAAAAFVASENDAILGVYRLAANQRDRGAHVGTAGFMVDPTARGRGAGAALGRHCLIEARRRGYAALQFNIVVSTNTAAVALWKKLGFAVIGTLPRVFRHAELGDVDALVMHRFLDDVPAEHATAPA